jgi:hypothetical protein
MVKRTQNLTGLLQLYNRCATRGRRLYALAIHAEPATTGGFTNCKGQVRCAAKPRLHTLAPAVVWFIYNCQNLVWLANKKSH